MKWLSLTSRRPTGLRALGIWLPTVPTLTAHPAFLTSLSTRVTSTFSNQEQAPPGGGLCSRSSSLGGGGGRGRGGTGTPGCFHAQRLTCSHTPTPLSPRREEQCDKAAVRLSVCSTHVVSGPAAVVAALSVPHPVALEPPIFSPLHHVRPRRSRVLAATAPGALGQRAMALAVGTAPH
jgi:hypothetical protein